MSEMDELVISSYHLVELSEKKNSGGPLVGPLTGANAELLIDGKPVKGCRSVAISLDASGVATVKIEIYARVSFSAIGEVSVVEVPIDASASRRGGEI